MARKCYVSRTIMPIVKVSLVTTGGYLPMVTRRGYYGYSVIDMFSAIVVITPVNAVT